MTSLVDRFVKRFGRWPTEVDTDYLEMLKMSKYRILTIPDKQTAKCANCGSCKEDGRGYIDINLDIEWHGTVFFCGYCLMDISKEMGLFKVLEKELYLALDELHRVREFKEHGENLMTQFNTKVKEVREYLDNLRFTGDDSGLDSSKSISSGESGIEASEQRVSTSKPRIAKSTSSSGRKDLPSLAELLKSDS